MEPARWAQANERLAIARGNQDFLPSASWTVRNRSGAPRTAEVPGGMGRTFGSAKSRTRATGARSPIVNRSSDTATRSTRESSARSRRAAATPSCFPGASARRPPPPLFQPEAPTIKTSVASEVDRHQPTRSRMKDGADQSCRRIGVADRRSVQPEQIPCAASTAMPARHAP